MGKQDFKFLDLLHYIGLLFLFLTSFFSLLYIFEGNVIVSGLVSILLLIFILFLVPVLVKNKELISKNKFSSQSMILMGIYLVLFLFSSYFITHLVNVEFGAKEKVKELVFQKTDVMNQMFIDFESVIDKDFAIYETELQTKLGQYFYGSTNSYNELINPQNKFRISAEEINLMNKQNYKQKTTEKLEGRKIGLFLNNPEYIKLKKENQLFTKETNEIFDAWRRMKLSSRYYELDKQIEKNEIYMNTLLQKEGFYMLKINPVKTTENLSLNSPSELMKTYTPNYLVILILIGLINVLILSPFFFTARETKYKKQTNNQAPTGGKSY